LGLAGAAAAAAGVVLASGAGAAAWVVRKGRTGGSWPAEGTGSRGRLPEAGAGEGAARAAGAAGGGRGAPGAPGAVEAGAQRQALPVAVRALQLSTAGMLGVGAALGVAVLALGLEPKREAVLSAEGVSDLYHEARKAVREEIGSPADPPCPPR